MEGWRISDFDPLGFCRSRGRGKEVKDDEPYDYLGQLFSEQNCAIDRMGQMMTPP